MRLSTQQTSAIRQAVATEFGPDARVFLFGSRIDDSARGGDIDLYVELDHPVANRAAAASRLSARIQFALGDQRIDVLLADPDTVRQPIHEVARAEGIAL